MNAAPQTPLTGPRREHSRDRAAIAALLIGLGALLLVAQWAEVPTLSLLIPLLLGLIFTGFGLFRREIGFLIPGGILTGVGAGVVLMTDTLAAASDSVKVGAMLLAFAAGWALITLASLLIGHAAWWPLIPGAIIGAVGLTFFMGETGMQLLEWAGRLWPLALIVIGGLILWRLWRRA